MAPTSSVYLAGSSQDLDRVELWRQALVDAGHRVTSTWIDTVKSVGSGNPRDASVGQRMEWSYADFAEVEAADVLWLLVPPPKLCSVHGSSIELGYAKRAGKRLVASGDTRCSIFCSIAHEYATDEEAFSLIRGGLVP